MDAYAVLGVDPAASDAEIREAYLRLSKRLHPDQQPADQRAAANLAMQELNAAYDELRHRDRDTPPNWSRPGAESPPYRDQFGGGTPPTRRRRLRWPLVVAVLLISSTLGVLLSSDASPPPNPRTDDDLSGLKGRCITLTESGLFDDVVDCTRPHDARVVEVVLHGEQCPLWSDSRLATAKQDLCLDSIA